jgi:hypothetical protein
MAETFTVKWTQRIEKLVIAAACFKSKTEVRTVKSAPIARMEMHGVPNLEDTFAIDFGSCLFLAIANATLDKPIRFVRRTLVVAIKAPRETAATRVRFPVVFAASASVEPDCARIR